MNLETKVPNRVEAARHLLRVQDASTNFLDYVKLMKPDWRNMPSFQLHLIDVLDKLEKGALKNDKGEPVRSVLINMPPRHSKSAVATELFPAYYMARKPWRKVMSCSYNGELAKDFGQKARDYAQHPFTGQAFPELKIDASSAAKDFWRTTDGGQYAGVGVGGTTTGRPANLLILDDPIKNREEAESATYRNKTWNYYISALSTRKEPTADGEEPIEIVILTRWHPDDVGGRIQESDDWKEGRWLHICFPAITEEDTQVQIVRSALPKDHPMWLPPGEVTKLTRSKRFVLEKKEAALWPERFSLETLKRQQRLNPREFEALYQQRPYIEGGNLIKTAWWQYYKEVPEGFTAVIIAVDTAFKKTELSDYSVATVWGLAYTGDIYLLDVMRGRFEFPELKRRLILLNAHWRGKGLRGIYVEDKASGQSLIQELKAQSGISVVPYKVVNDKVARLNAVLPMIEGGRVFIPEQAPWLDDFIKECVEFPNGAHDDQVDSMSIGLDAMARMNLQSPELMMGPINMGTSLNQVMATMSKGSLMAQIGKKAGNLFKGWGE